MVESFPKQFFMMFKLPLILACAIFSAHMACAAATDKYSVIPEPVSYTHLTLPTKSLV